MASSDGPVCLFCNKTTAGESEVVQLTDNAEWTDASGTYWCHGACLQAATHPAVPLYLLSLKRDAAVYGTKGREVSDADMPVRMLSERQAFRAARYFLEQFNEREGSDALALLATWMIEQDDSRVSADPAQWHDWVQVVDRVLAESDG